MIGAIDEKNREQVNDLIENSWGGRFIATRGRMLDTAQLPGFVYEEKGMVAGAVTYHIKQAACEIVTLDSLRENKGIGTALLAAAVEAGQKAGCTRIWLVTTNDNIRAIRFYQKRGFTLAALHLGAMSEARKLKESIPLYGCEGIPLQHELEFEWTQV